MKDIYMHLTNYSINKHNKHFVPNDDDWGSDGHKRSLNQIYHDIIKKKGKGFWP
jgi:hypothetical protein